MTTENIDEENIKKTEQPEKQSGEITFKCKYCGKAKPLADSRRTDRYFPPTVICSDCEKNLR